MTDDPLDEIEVNRAMANIAAILRAYYTALIDEGFTADEALRITIAYQANLRASE